MWLVWEYDMSKGSIVRTRFFRSETPAQDWITRNRRNEYLYITRLVTKTSIISKLRQQLNLRAATEKVKSRFLKV